LRNVVERAVILARGGALDFDLPFTGQAAPVAQGSPRADSPVGSPAGPKFLTEAEVERFERDNLAAALEAANWKISGPDSAAELLGVKPTTMLSRMTKWGLKRPERGPA
jgi:transcriptional regulator with GAF, ATPase, and Fis domain